MQLQIESLKNSGLTGFANPDLRDTGAALKPTELASWSLNWFVIYQGKM